MPNKKMFLKKLEKVSCRKKQNNFQKAENLKKIRSCRNFLYAYEN